MPLAAPVETDLAERLATLLDGRLDPARRAATLGYLGRTPAAVESLADAAAVVREIERARRADPLHVLHAWAARRTR